MALASLLGAFSGGSFTVLLQASSPSLFAGVDCPRVLATAPLAPLASNALPDEAVALLIKEGALPLNATSVGGAPTAPGTVVSVVAASVEKVALAADVWIFHSSAPNPAAALSRGVPLTGGGWFLPLDFSGWSGVVGAAPTGVVLSVVTVQWSLTGAPLAGLYQPPGLLSGAVGGAHQVALPAATSLTATVPAGTLRPGYVYRPTAIFSLTARWSFAARPQPWAVGGTLAPPPALSGVAFDANENVAPPQVVSAYAPLLYVHAPPVGGIVGVAPASGTALLTQFSISSAGWVSGDAAVLLNSPPSALAPSTVAALALTVGQGAPSGSATPCLGAGGALQALISTALGATSEAALCIIAANGRAASAATLAAIAPLPTALIYSYTITDDAATVLSAQSSSGWPLGLFANAAGALSASGYAALAQLQAPLRAGAAFLPGATLAKGLIFPSLPQQTLSSMAAPEATVQTMLLSATAIDSYGGVGVGFGFVALAPVAAAAPPPSAGLAAAANFVATSLGGGAGGSAGSAYNAVLLVSQVAAGASLLASAGTGASPAVTSVRTSLLVSIANAAPALAPSDPATVASAAASSLSSVSSLVAAAAVAAAADPPNTPAEAAAAATLAAAAASSVGSLLGLYNATGLPIPVAPFAGVLSGALAVAASGTGGGTAPMVSAAGLPLGGNTLPLSTGGVAPALRENITSALSAVASSLLAGAALDGTPLGLTTAPPAAVNRAPPLAPYCGPGISLSTVRVAANAQREIAFAVGSPMNPCLPSSGDATVTLPAAAVAAQPPPTAVLPRAVLNALAAATGGAAFDIQMVQWGVSPNPESAFASTRHSSLPAVSDAAVNVTLSAPFEAAAGSRRRRGLLSSWFFSVVASLGGRTAGQASLDALTTASPRAVTDEDLLPHRPMDSRTVSVRVNPAGSSQSLAGLVTPEPFTLVIPLRDLSIMEIGPSGGFSINLGQAAFAARTFNVTCPLSLAAAQAGAVAFELTPSGAMGARVPVKLVKALQVDFTDIVAELVDAAGSASGSDGALAGGGMDASLSTIPGADSAAGGAATASPPPVVASAFFSYILSIDCGSPFGARTLVCGPNSGGAMVKYACPVAVPVPKCYWFNEAARVWTTVGTSVLGADLTSVNCSTVHMADHAVRFATLPQVLADVFYQQAPLTQVAFFSPSPAFFVAAAVMLAVCLAGATVGCSRDAEAKGRWAAALAAHPEVTWLVHECRAAGTPFSLLPPGSNNRGAKVVPNDEANPQQSATPAPPVRGVRALVPAAVALSSAPLHNALSAAAIDYFAPYRAASSGWASSNAPQSGPAPAPPPPLDAFLDEWRATRAPTHNRAMNALRGGAAPALLCRLTCHRLRSVPPPLLVAAWPLLYCGGSGPRTPTAYFHPALSASLPAPTRILISLCAALVCAAGACALYTPLLGAAAPRGKLQLPALSAAQLAALSAAVAFCVGAPLDILLCFLLKALARARVAWASPSLARERERRAAAAALLSPLPSSALAALLGRPLGPEEAGALDSAAPPGWVSPPSWLLTLVPSFAYTMGRHPAQADAAVDAAVAAAAESPTDVAGLSRALSERLLEAAAGAPSAPSPLRAFCTSPTVWASALLAAVSGYAFSYVRAWVVTRGTAAGASVTAAWALSLALFLVAAAPALRAAELALAPFFFSATAWIPAPAPGDFAAWSALDGWAAVTAAGRASGWAEADALAALLPPHALAALAAHATDASPDKESRARRLRAALLVRAYHRLLEHAAATDAVAAQPASPGGGSSSPPNSSISAPRFAYPSGSASPPPPLPAFSALPALAQPLADADSLNGLIVHPLTTRLGAKPLFSIRSANLQLKSAMRERSATASGIFAEGGGESRSQKGLNLLRGTL